MVICRIAVGDLDVCSRTTVRGFRRRQGSGKRHALLPGRWQICKIKEMVSFLVKIYNFCLLLAGLAQHANQLSERNIRSDVRVLAAERVGSAQFSRNPSFPTTQKFGLQSGTSLTSANDDVHYRQ